MRLCLIAVLFATTAFAAEKKPISAEALLAQTIERPGFFAQMCDAPAPIDSKIPVPV